MIIKIKKLILIGFFVITSSLYASCEPINLKIDGIANFVFYKGNDFIHSNNQSLKLKKLRVIKSVTVCRKNIGTSSKQYLISRTRKNVFFLCGWKTNTIGQVISSAQLAPIEIPHFHLNSLKTFYIKIFYTPPAVSNLMAEHTVNIDGVMNFVGENVENFVMVWKVLDSKNLVYKLSISAKNTWISIVGDKRLKNKGIVEIIVEYESDRKSIKRYNHNIDPINLLFFSNNGKSNIILELAAANILDYTIYNESNDVLSIEKNIKIDEIGNIYISTPEGLKYYLYRIALMDDHGKFIVENQYNEFSFN